jgi:phospholipid transport system substrate-binding protein
MVHLTRRTVLGSLLALTMFASRPVPAQSAEPPQTVIDSFYGSLLGVMKEASTLGFQGRYKRLEPVIDKTYNLPLMTRISVGPQWNSLTPDQQGQLVERFKRYTVATYASRFDGFDGERFEVNPTPSPSQGNDMIVETKLVPSHAEPVVLNYLMRQSDDGWHVIDVFLSGTISELATRRSEFTSLLRSSGPDGLIAELDKRIKTMAGTP